MTIDYGIKLDDWQKEFLETKGDKILCCGRQIGKSVICSMDAGLWAVNNPKQNVLIIAPTERQAFALFEKTLNFLTTNYPTYIAKGKNRPTQTRIILTNKTKIFCLPTGLAGTGVRFLTVGRLYADEAAYIPEAVWTAITPMLLTTGGDTILLSTPSGANNYFADVMNNKKGAFDQYSRFSYSSREVIEKREVCDSWTDFQRTKALEYLDSERARKTKLHYAQEYEGQIVEALTAFFPKEVIRGCMTQEMLSDEEYVRLRTLPMTRSYCGVDVARKGNDDTVIVELLMNSKKQMIMTYYCILNDLLLTQTARYIRDENKKRNFNKIYVDDNGVGSGVLDNLLEYPETKRKVVGINNKRRSVDNEKEIKKKLLKEDLYNNLLKLMEDQQIRLLDDEEVYQSLISVQKEYQDNGTIKIYGNYTHITEALVRAAWAFKDKTLNIYAYFS